MSCSAVVAVVGGCTWVGCCCRTLVALVAGGSMGIGGSTLRSRAVAEEDSLRKDIGVVVGNTRHNHYHCHNHYHTHYHSHTQAADTAVAYNMVVAAEAAVVVVAASVIS